MSKSDVFGVPDLSDRGGRLWQSYCDVVDDAGLVLLEEACRIADRLDRLDGLLRGDEDVWCRLTHNLRTESYEIKIDSALVEARQQAAVLRQILVTLPRKEASGDGDDGAFLADVRTPLGDESES